MLNRGHRWKTGACALAPFVLVWSAAVASAQGRDQALAAARAQELVELERRIGRFASGDVAVYVGELGVSAEGARAVPTDLPRGRVVAWLEEVEDLGSGLGPGTTLTVVSPKQAAWMRFSQPASRPERTLATRPRPLRGTAGLAGTCYGCLADLSARASTLEFRRFVAKGQVRGLFGEEFRVEADGRLEVVPPGRLELSDIEVLNPGLEPLLRGEVGEFTRRGGEAIQRVEREVRRRLPRQKPPPSQLLCDRVSRYSAERFVDLDDLRSYGVRNLEIIAHQICCFDHDGHGGDEACREEKRG